jgi:hypothetical protein
MLFFMNIHQEIIMIKAIDRIIALDLVTFILQLDPLVQLFSYYLSGWPLYRNESSYLMELKTKESFIYS